MKEKQNEPKNNEEGNNENPNNENAIKEVEQNISNINISDMFENKAQDLSQRARDFFEGMTPTLYTNNNISNIQKGSDINYISNINMSDTNGDNNHNISFNLKEEGNYYIYIIF